MCILSDKEFNKLKTIFGCTDKVLKSLMRSYLEKYYKEIYTTDDYLYAVGSVPVAIVAHLDTVHQVPPEDFFYDPKRYTIWSPDGLGADDRAGVYAITKIIAAGYRPHIILTMGEEYGGIGAAEFIKKVQKPQGLKYIIELDRRGQNDCVFYNCHNPDFINYVESFGFIKECGSFSDISIICPPWKVAGVNLSIGYENEHSAVEFLNIRYMFNTIERVKQMLEDINSAPKFEYMEFKLGYSFLTDMVDSNSSGICDRCGSHYNATDGFKVGDEMWCMNCALNYADWCDRCSAMHPITADGINLCERCRENK